jgi:hypothetical protein
LPRERTFKKKFHVFRVILAWVRPLNVERRNFVAAGVSPAGSGGVSPPVASFDGKQADAKRIA